MRGVAAAMLALASVAILAAQEKNESGVRNRRVGGRTAEAFVLRGTIQDTGGTSGKFVLRVSISRLEANPKAPGAWKAVQKEGLDRQDAILRIPDVLERIQEMTRLTLEARRVLAREKDVFTF